MLPTQFTLYPRRPGSNAFYSVFTADEPANKARAGRSYGNHVAIICLHACEGRYPTALQVTNSLIKAKQALESSIESSSKWVVALQEKLTKYLADRGTQKPETFEQGSWCHELSMDITRESFAIDFKKQKLRELARAQQYILEGKIEFRKI